MESPGSGWAAWVVVNGSIRTRSRSSCFMVCLARLASLYSCRERAFLPSPDSPRNRKAIPRVRPIHGPRLPRLLPAACRSGLRTAEAHVVGGVRRLQRGEHGDAHQHRVVLLLLQADRAGAAELQHVGIALVAAVAGDQQRV